MRVLVVFCHPDPASYCAALRDAALAALARAGHAVDLLDLYASGFDPVLSAAERATYLADTARNVAGVADHVERLRRAEALVVVYPTWFYGPPAMLKGWLERTWLPGVAFAPPRFKGERVRGALTNIRAFVGITTSGAPWWWLRLIRDPGRSLFMQGLRPLYAPACRARWLQLHSMNNASAADRERFLARVGRVLAAL
jgi:putative NADPH-quinone reductase